MKALSNASVACFAATARIEVGCFSISLRTRVIAFALDGVLVFAQISIKFGAIRLFTMEFCQNRSLQGNLLNTSSGDPE